MRRPWFRIAAVATAAAMTASSCGLSPKSAHDLATAQQSSGNVNSGSAGGLASGSPSGSAGGVSNGGTAGATGSNGASSTPGARTGGSSSSVSSNSSGGGSSTSGSSSSGGGSAASGAGGTSSGGGSYESIGIRGGVIYIGIHAPETGAAPVPLQAFVTGTKLFWENHTVFGHRVVMQFTDDQYRPDVARQVCETMSRQDLFVIGGAGTDQIQACATDPVLTASHTPYFSAGVTTNGLQNLPYYFALTQSYAAQSAEVYTMANSLYSANAHLKWAVVTESTANFADAQASMDQALAANHVPYCNVATPKYFSESDAANAVGAASRCGAKIVYLDVDPNFWIDMVREATAQAFTPDWVGPGITNGENLVAAPVCGEQAVIKAAFLSPYMGLDRQPAGFSSEKNPAPDGVASERDIELLIYGLSEAVYNAMLSVGSFTNLTRDNLIAAMRNFSSTYGSQLTVLPTIAMRGGHFGGTGAWELQLNCSQGQYTTYGRLP